MEMATKTMPYYWGKSKDLQGCMGTLGKTFCDR